jgi:hypothetical protein
VSDDDRKMRVLRLEVPMPLNLVGPLLLAVSETLAGLGYSDPTISTREGTYLVEAWPPGVSPPPPADPATRPESAPS